MLTLRSLLLCNAVAILTCAMSAQCQVGPADAQIVLSEIMFDPIGSEFYDEFVEIYNRSAVDTIDLTGWAIGDGIASDALVAAGRGARLNPQSYGLILDSGYREHSTTYDHLIPDSILVLTIAGASFGQSGWTNARAKPVTLYSPRQEIVDRVTYSPGNRPGHSDERLNPADDQSKWADSLILHGTPGFGNSVGLKGRDLQMSHLEWVANPLSHDGQPEVDVHFLNRGLSSISLFSIAVYVDTDLDSVPEQDERVSLFQFEEALHAGDSVSVFLSLPRIGSGVHRMFFWASMTGDEDRANDIISATLRVGYPRHSVVFNEVMYRPLTGEPEWIEVTNLSSGVVQLTEWQLIETATGRGFPLANGPLLLESGGHLVVAAGFLSNAPDEAVIVPSTFPTLNNNKEQLFLLDAARQIIDVLSYESHWGGDVGVSLERINPDYHLPDSSNWVSSADPMGSTPGKRNSVFAVTIPSTTFVSVSPNPFSPNGDGHEDTAIIQVDLPVATATMSITVFDIMGRRVGELLNNAPTGTRRVLIWQGLGWDGRPLPPGVYILVIEALNHDQGILERMKTVVAIAGSR